MTSLAHYLARLVGAAPALRAKGLFFAAEAAAHAHIAAATGSLPSGPIRYTGLAPRQVAVLGPNLADVAAFASEHRLAADESSVADVLRGSLDLFVAEVTLGDGTVLPVLRREATLAELLSRGGLAIGLAGILLRFRGADPLDVDEVRELLKAAQQPERYRALPELLAVV